MNERIFVSYAYNNINNSNNKNLCLKMLELIRAGACNLTILGEGERQLLGTRMEFFLKRCGLLVQIGGNLYYPSVLNAAYKDLTSMDKKTREMAAIWVNVTFEYVAILQNNQQTPNFFAQIYAHHKNLACAAMKQDDNGFREVAEKIHFYFTSNGDSIFYSPSGFSDPISSKFLNDLGVRTQIIPETPFGQTLYAILNELRSKGYSIPTKICTQSSKNSASVAFCNRLPGDAVNSPLNFSPNIVTATNSNLSTIRQFTSCYGSVSPFPLRAFICHELGHYYHDIEIEKQYNSSYGFPVDFLTHKREIFNAKIKDKNNPGQLTALGCKIVNQVSSYATTSVDEFIAELFARFMCGDTANIDREILDLYKEFCGPIF